MLKKNRLRSIVAILIMAILPIVMFVWMTYEKDLFSKPVYVAKTDIEMGTVIDDIDNFFKIAKMEEELLINDSLTPDKAASIKGKGVNQFIPANGQVNNAFFEDPGIIVSEDKMVLKIPNSWIYAVPTSIRRGDIIKFYKVNSNIEKNYAANITQEEESPFNKDSEDPAKVSKDDFLATYDIDIKMDSEDPVLISSVIHIKDGSNREVVDADGSPYRYDGTSQVSSIEIVCTKDDIHKLLDQVSKGFKFILVY